MKILVDIGHPAHVHLFRNFIGEIIKKGADVFVTIKNIPSAKRLLEIYGIKYIDLGLKSDNINKKIINQLRYNRQVYKLVNDLKVDIGMGSSIAIAHVSKISKMKSFVFDDDDDNVQPLFVKFAHPFCDFLLSPSALKGNRKKPGTIFYNSYHDLAYLHPNQFTPDPSVVTGLGLTIYDTFFIVRFNAFKAHHDIHKSGITLENKRILIDFLNSKGKVFITSERETDEEFKSYQLNIPPDKIHSLLYYAALFVGDSQSMTSEAAVLGTPALKSNSFAGKLSVPNEIEKKYQLCFSYQPNDFQGLLSKINEILALPNLKQIWHERRDIMLKDKIDLTAFMVWMIDKFPDSIKILRENPDFQNTFK